MKKNVIFMGTPQIAVPSLQALLDSTGYNVSLVISQPDKPKGRGNQLQATPVKELALAHNIPVYQPDKIKNNPEALERLIIEKPDFFAVVAYGKILPKEILDIPTFVPVNVHFSLLPLYRGAAPVNRAILNGDEYTGVDTMKMGVGMDDGDILLSERTPIANKDAAQLADELAITGAALLIKTLDNFTSITPQPQDHSLVSLAPMLSKAEGAIDWTRDAAYIERMTRAFVPWPSAYTQLDGKLLKIFAATVDTKYNDNQAGVVYSVGKDGFSIGTGSGGLIVKELQLEGKKRMAAAGFLAGYKLALGSKLG
ncbi:MAG: methionyl-tRNA formyltransferase [Deferribacteraceae bacterium]|jgi:methionyl-tRNA formyltransferase|nr:methionyl-tRNA formyltransferase [Deferribacteraceae bacterium]